jgi:hypothetical protein
VTSWERPSEHAAFSAEPGGGCVRDAYVLDLQDRIGAYAHSVTPRLRRGVWCLVAVDALGVHLACAAAPELAVALHDLLADLEARACAALRAPRIPPEARSVAVTATPVVALG